MYFRNTQEEKDCMWEIKGGSKARRILWDAEQNQLSWAYMKMLREHFDKKKIYDINPFVEVYQFRDNLYGLFTPNCDGMGDPWMWLIIGPEKAMLIDTAFGLGDLKGLVDEITGGMPLIVANTHQGPDHAFGNCHFDKVYCHEQMAWLISQQNNNQWDYLFDENGNGKWITITREDLPTFKPYELIPVPNNTVFNLGGDYDVELIYLPGHGTGHCGFMDKKNRILFVGDIVVADSAGIGSGPRPGMPYGECCTLEALRNELVKVCARMDEFDYIYCSHFMVDVENHVLNNIVDAINEVLEDPNNYTYRVVRYGKDGKPHYSYYKHVIGWSTFNYVMNGVYINKRIEE